MTHYIKEMLQTVYAGILQSVVDSFDQDNCKRMKRVNTALNGFRKKSGNIPSSNTDGNTFDIIQHMSVSPA